MVLGYTPPPKEVEEIEEEPIEVEEYTPPKYWNTCVECGKFFGTDNKRCVLCSEECKKIRNRRKSKTARVNQRYCTTECSKLGSKLTVKN